jgi:hypothetical protein
MLNYVNTSPSFLQFVIRQEAKCYYGINTNDYQVMNFMHFATLACLISLKTILII